MGSWNGTCGVSQLSINSGDPVAFFLIANVNDQEGHDDGFCHAEDIWCPLGLPIYAEYNDYGSIYHFKNMDTVTQYLNLFQKMAVPVVAKNKYRCGVDPATLDFDQMEDALHEGILRIRDLAGFEYSRELAKVADLPDVADEVKDVAERYKGRSHSFRVGTMMVHQEIYDGLAASYPHWLYETPISFDTVYKRAKLSYDHLVNEIKGDTIVLDRFGPMMTLELFLGRDDSNRDCLLVSFFKSYPIYARQYINAYGTALIEAAKAGDPEPPLLAEICKFQIFRVNFQFLRKAWGPQSGAGSQQNNQDDHARLIGMMSAIIERKKQEWVDENLTDEEMAELEAKGEL